MATTTTSGVEVFYRDEGAGEAILMIHGHTFDHTVFDPQAAALTGQGFRVLRPDLRGHGRSERPPVGYHPSHHAADMAAVLEHAGVDRATVVGYSVGGAVALELALADPDRVGALVLLAPVMPDRPFEEAFMTNLKQVARTARGEGIAAAMAGPWLDSPLFAHSFATPGLRDRVAAIVARFPGAEYLAEARDRVERDWIVPDRLGEVAAPAVVAVGDHELPGFRAFAEEAASGLPTARLEVLPECGHLLPFEAEQEVTRLVAEAASGSSSQ